MKIYTSNYRNHWISPYTILQKMFFWREIDYDEPLIEFLSDKIMPFSIIIKKILDIIHPKIDYVKIDKYDTWNMDATLTKIIIPMLKQLKATKHGAPFVDDEDVPEELKSTSAPAKENEWDIDGNHFKRWNYVLNEMIFAFEHLNDSSWEDEYRSGIIHHIGVPIDENGNTVSKKEAKYYRMDQGPNHTYECDYDGIKAVEARMQIGFVLFGKYYRGLWD